MKKDNNDEIKKLAFAILRIHFLEVLISVVSLYLLSKMEKNISEVISLPVYNTVSLIIIYGVGIFLLVFMSKNAFEFFKMTQFLLKNFNSSNRILKFFWERKIGIVKQIKNSQLSINDLLLNTKICIKKETKKTINLINIELESMRSRINM